MLEDSESLAEARSEAKPSSSVFKSSVLGWIGIALIVLGGTILFTSYVYVPLDVWSGGAPWDPTTWQYHFGSSYFAGGWVGVIPLVAGIVIYLAARMMKPKE